MKQQRRRRGSRDKDSTTRTISDGRNSGGGGAGSSSSGGGDFSSSTTLLIQLHDPKDGTQIPWYEYGRNGNLAGRDATVVSHPPPMHKKSKGADNKYLNRNDGSAAAVFVVSRELVDRYRARADALIRNQIQTYNSKSSSSDDRWVESTLHRGTLKDRVAAMSVLVSTEPIYKSYALDLLLQMAGCSVVQQQQQDDNDRRNAGTSSSSSTNSRVALMAAEALEDLFLNTLIPPDRKLLTLAQRPLYLYEQDATTTISPRLLILWRYEELLHHKFVAFVEQYYMRTLRNGLEMDKIFCLRSAANVLKSAPEGESMLLQLLVDKLGDPNKKVAAAAAHQLRDVLGRHPVMTTVVAREVMQLTHRPNLSHRALYNAVTFLNQLRLIREEEEKHGDGEEEDGKSKNAKPYSSSNSLAASLMSTYFRLFEVAVAANKIIPSGNGGDGGGSGGKNKIQKNGKCGRNKGGSNEKEEQELIAMKSRLLSALLTGVNRAHPYLPRGHDRLLDKHVDALYRVVHTASPATSTQALMLLFHAIVAVKGDGGEIGNYDESTKDVLQDPETEKKRERFYRALYSTLSPSMLGSGKHLTMFFNLLYKALKYDIDTTRVVAFAKRILSTSLQCSNTPTVLSSALFLINEIGKYHPRVRQCGCEVLRGKDALRILDYSKREPRGALTTLKSTSTASAETGQRTSNGINVDILESFSSNKLAPLWELSLSKHHFHPSVVKFTEMFGGEIKYAGDPLRDFGLAPFLDKFAYRNPKSSERVAQQQRTGSVADMRWKRTVAASTPVNDPSFWDQQKEIEAQDEFFHKFFAEREKRDRLKGIVRTKKSEEEEEEDNAVAYDVMEEAESGYNADRKFEDFEHQWETDSEEEAFVDSLAEKIIEDSVHAAGPILDDEDPDMDGWSDMNDDDDDDDDDEDDDEDEAWEYKNEGKSHSRHIKIPFQGDDEFGDQEEGHEDAFMDDADEEDSESDQEAEAALLQGEEKITSFAGGQFGADGESSDDGDHADETDLALLDDDDDMISDDGAEEAAPKGKPWKMAKKSASSSTFASLEEYEERINESFFKAKKLRPDACGGIPDRQQQESVDEDAGGAGQINTRPPQTEKKAKRKTKNTKNKRRKTT